MVSKPPFGHLHPAPCLTQKSFSFSSCVPCTGTNLSPKSPPLFTNQHQKQAQRLLMCQTMESATHRNSPHVSPVFHALFWSTKDLHEWTQKLPIYQTSESTATKICAHAHTCYHALQHAPMLFCMPPLLACYFLSCRPVRLCPIDSTWLGDSTQSLFTLVRLFYLSSPTPPIRSNPALRPGLVRFN
jgi:hypothetical protein